MGHSERRAAEKVCLRQVQTMLQPVGKKHVGRGRKPVVIKTPIQAALASELTGAATHKVSSLLKLQRRLGQLVHKLQHAPTEPLCSAARELYIYTFPLPIGCPHYSACFLVCACTCGVLSLFISSYQEVLKGI